MLPVLSVFYIWQSTLVTEPPRNIAVGPRTVPLLIGWLMLGVSLLLTWQQVRTRRPGAAIRPEATHSSSDDDDNRISDWPAVWWVLGAFLLLVLLFDKLGFIISTALFISGVATLFAPRQWHWNLTAAVGFGAAFYFLFTLLLGIELPKGLLESLL